MPQEPVYDLAIIGGGINGCGIARDAAGRGLKVLLCEQGDLGGATSSASTKLIHGGLRYLEYYEFRLVRESLREREVLWGAAPHIIRPLRFVLPHHAGLRPAWLLRLGLFLYDHIGGRRLLPPTRALDLRRDAAGQPLRPGFRRGFEYSDCWVDDSRLVILNARDAADRGAEILVRHRLARAARRDGLWHLDIEQASTGRLRRVQARAVVNAAGPWVAEVAQKRAGLRVSERVRLVRGSHIIVPRLYDHGRAYILQNGDGRILFVIPYEQDFSLIGTTDRDHHDSPEDAHITEAEISYLCDAVSDYLRAPVRPEHVVHTFSGVRPLYDDGTREAAAATRDYVLKLDAGDGGAPFLNIFGGKITTYRRLAEQALARLRPYFPDMTGPWTATAPLPGGDFGINDAEARIRALMDRHPFLDRQWAVRLFRAYGTRATEVLAGARRPEDLGEAFGATLTEAEVRHLIAHEWARTAEDVLWRRSKLGLRLTPAQAARLAEFMAGAVTAPPDPATEARRWA